MSVVTINLDDFLSIKKDGEVVTADDWNKLMALFQSINQNASELLALIKTVDNVRADMVNVVSHGVADNSVGYTKLEKQDSTKQVYELNTDTEPQPGVTYYTLEGTTYIPHEGLTEFEDTQYYVLNTTASSAAIAADDVIADGVISGSKLKLGTLLANVCSELLLGGLLNDNVTIYKNKGFTGTFKKTDALNTKREEKITFEKAHKALIVINDHCISLYTASLETPDLHIGSEYMSAGYRGLCINTLIGANKRSVAPQGVTSAANLSTVAGYPTGLAGGGIYAQLSTAYYDYANKTLHATVNFIYNPNWDVPYSFGNLIIGL